MTEEEIDRLRAAKAEVSEWLGRVRLGRYGIGRVDKRISEYIREVCRNPEGHNLYEQLAVRRFLHMCEKYGLDRGQVVKFFTMYESLKFPGKKGDTCYKLTPVQTFQFASIYGFWDGPRRVVREACLFVPRKFSKTTSTASLAVNDLLFGDANAEAYVGANSSDQAKKCFDVIRGAMRHLDPGERRYLVNEQRIKSRRRDRSAFAQCLTANARTKDGLNASTVIMDEFSQARDSDLLTVLTTSMGVRDNPLTVIITTASSVFDGPFYEMLQGYKSLLLGEYEDDSVFVHIFEPDVGDAEDSPATWHKVHPHLGVTVNADFYEQEYRKAMRNGAEAMLAFRTKLLNIYTENNTKAWISATEAREHMRPFRIEDIKGKPLGMMAIDLSVRDDFSAVSVGGYDSERKSMWLHTAYFFPDGALSGHINEKLYRKWAADGYLKLTHGKTIDYDEIAEYVLHVTDYVNVAGIGYDRYKSNDFVNKLGNSREGVWNVLREVSQQVGNFTAPVGTFEYGFLNGQITINDNPINAYCFGNAVLYYDNMDNCKPMKRVHSQKIDGVITMLMVIRQIIDFKW